MIFEADSFDFQPPRAIAFARRILIKPGAACAEPHPVTTSPETLLKIINGIRRISHADILLLERSSGQESMHSIYKELGYNFPHTMLLDVDKCAPVAVENPLPRPFALSTFWIPNVILSCDFLITVAPFKLKEGGGDFSIKNVLGLLPAAKYKSEIKAIEDGEQKSYIDNITADLYFTLPFDMGIIDGRKKLVRVEGSIDVKIENYGKIFIGSPYEVDFEAAQAAGIMPNYLRLIEEAKAEQRRLTDDAGH